MTGSDTSSKVETQFHGPEDLEKATRDAFLQFFLSLADTKYVLGRRLSEWTTGAPTLEATVACAAVTQEEFGHARSIYSLLRDFSDSPAELSSANDLQREQYYYPEALEKSWGSWGDVVAAFLLLDEMFSALLASARNSQYQPLRVRIEKILQEERFHRIFFRGWLAEFSSGGESARRKLQDSLDRFAGLPHQWLGPPGEPVLAELVAQGIFSEDRDAICRSWRQPLQELLSDNQFRLVETEPDWSRWEPKTRSLGG